jgi:catecholate siderophore receptor
VECHSNDPLKRANHRVRAFPPHRLATMPANLRATPLQTALLLALTLPTVTHAQTTSQVGDTSSTPQAAGNPKTLSSVHVTGSVVGNDYDADVSTVGAKVPTSLRDIPQSIVVVNRDLLDAQGATSLQDALRNVPGITIGGAEGGQIGNNINLRGFTARTDIYLDGFRDPGQYYRDTFDLSAIEVLKGPSSMLFGRGSTGGVINQVTKEPELKAFGEVTATVGSSDRYRTTADFNQPLSDTAAVRLNVYGQDMHSTRDVAKNQDGGITTCPTTVCHRSTDVRPKSTTKTGTDSPTTAPIRASMNSMRV